MNKYYVITAQSYKQSKLLFLDQLLRCIPLCVEVLIFLSHMHLLYVVAGL